MNIKRVRAVFFSGTGTTEKIVTAIAKNIAAILDVKFEITNFSLPAARVNSLCFKADELILFGIFVVAGRMPNLLLPYLETIEGGGSPIVPIVLYGNRHYDDALIELCDILSSRGARCIAAAAFVGEHSFSEVLAKGRPDESDMMKAEAFAIQVAEKIISGPTSLPSCAVQGTPYPYRGYYQPLDESGSPVRFLNAKPATDARCTNCKLCADLCPMGAISRTNVSEVPGVCIKCCACIKKCPAKAKSFTDENFLSHRALLEKIYQRRMEPETFI